MLVSVKGRIQGTLFVLVLCHVLSAYSEEAVLNIATQNLHRFYDMHDDPRRKDTVLSPASFTTKLEKTAWFISNQLSCPDIVAVQELENINTLKQLASKACRDRLFYTPYLLEGHDYSGMDVGFLVSDKLKVGRVSQLAFSAKQKGARGYLFDRPPLLLELENGQCGIENVYLVVVHNRSFKGLRSVHKRERVLKKRMQQAEWLGDWVKAWQQSHEGDALILLGDFNALAMGEELKRMQKKASVGRRPLLKDLGLKIPEPERYSYRFRGNKQAIDHIFATENLFSLVAEVQYTRFNTQWVSGKPRNERISDHEGMVAQFDFSSCKTNWASNGGHL